MKLDFKWVKNLGDDTAVYDVEFDEEFTLEELIGHVSGKYDRVCIYRGKSLNDARRDTLICNCGRSRVQENSDDFYDIIHRSVRSIKANGWGYFYMTFVVDIEE